VGLYQDASGNWGYFTSAYDRYSAWLYEGTPKNLADYRKIRLKLDASDYTMATFQFQYQVSHYMAADSIEWVDNLNLLSGTASHSITVYDANGTEVAAADRQIGQWYTAVVKNTAGNVADTVVMYTCGYSGSNDNQVVEMEMLVKNIQGYKAVTMPVYNNADSSVSVESAGIIDVLTQDGNNIRYQLTADKIPYLSGANAVRVKLLDNTKQVISMKFTVNTLTDASGAASTPWTRVVTGSGNEANFAVIDEDGNLVKNIAAGKTYTLFITSPEFATNLYSKPSVPTEFVVYPVGMDTQSVADITFSEIAAHAVSGFSSNEGAITHTTTMVHNNLSYYKVGDQWNFSFSASEALFRGNTTAVSTAFTPAASATMLTLPSGNVQAVSMRVRYVEGMNDGAERYTMAASCTVTFYDDNGNVVALADRKAGQWYNVSLTNITGNTVTIYPAGHDLKNAAIMLQVEDITVMAEDTNPVTIASTETSWVTLTYELVNGKPAYTFNSTAYAAANNSSAWQRCLTLTNPLNEAAVLTMDFKFLSNTDGDGNAIRASVAGYTGPTAVTNYAIVEKDTGKLVGKCEMGKEYTLFVSAAAGATVRIHTDMDHVGTTNFQMVITDRAALEAPAAGDVTLTANSLSYGNLATYYVDGEWRYGFTTYTGIQSTGASGHYYRRLFMKQAADTYSQVSFEFKYDVAQKVATDGTVTEITDDLMLSGAKYYTMDGVQVTNRTFTVGQWYKVVVTSDTTLGASLDVFPLREQNRVADSYELEITTAFRNFVALEPDTSPVTVFEADVKNQVALTHDVVDGKHVYTYTTIGTVAPSNAGWSRRQGLRVPEGTTHFAVNFRYTKAYGENGTTEIVPTMSVYKSNLTSNAVTYIYETATGKMVSSGNANNAALTVGTWYTAVVTTEGETSLYMYPCNNSSEKVQVTFEIADRSTCIAGNEVAVFNTPWGDFPEPVYAYINGEWIQKINGSANQVTQEHKQIAVTMRQDGILRVTFEMMMDNATGSAKAHIWNSIGNLKIYNANGDAVSGNALESGVWYTYVYETGANLGTSEIRFGYLGSSTGGLDASIRNVQVTELGNFNVSFNLNYEGATNTPAAITVQQGAAYGTLPTPADREYYTFAGWYTNAACTGSAVTEDTTVSASHTLYAKWDLKPDTNTVVVDSVINGSLTRDIVEGENVYTYSVSGVAGSMNKKVKITFPEGQTYVAVEFCFTESKTAAGADLAPYLRIYDQSNGGNNGTYINTIWIYDADGNQVTTNNTATSLTVGQWYTVVVQMNTGTNFFMCPLSHYTADAPTITMKIRDRAVQTETVAVAARDANNLTLTRKLENGELLYHMSTITAKSPGTSAWQWAATITPPSNDHSHVAVTFRINEAYESDGITAVTPNMTVWRGTASGEGVGMWIYDVETGTLVDSGNNKGALELGKWYTVVMENPAGVLQTYYRLTPCYGISGARFDMDVKAADYTDMCGSLNTASMGKALHYMDGIWQWEFLASSKTTLTGDNRGLIITMYDDGMTSVSFDFMFTDLSGALTGKFSGSNMTIYDLETNEAVSASALSEGTWYKLVYNPGTNIGTAAKKFTYPGGWGSEDIGGMNLYIRNLQASAS